MLKSSTEMSNRSVATAAAAFAGLVIALGLLVTPAAAALPTTYRVSNCTALVEKLAAIDTIMTNVTKKGKYRFNIELDCGASANFADCPSMDQLTVSWGPEPGKNVPTLEIVIRGAPGCVGDKRPTLSAVLTNHTRGLPLFSINVRQQVWWLTNLVIDCLDERNAISANEGGGLTLTNVDVSNCVSGAVGAASTPLTISGGKFSNNMVMEDGPGGAIYVHADGKSKDVVSIKGAKFIANSAGKGGAIYIYKTSPKAAQFSCSQCEFSWNEAPYGSAIMVVREDTVQVNGVAKPGLPPTVKINFSKFEGNGDPATAFCGNTTDTKALKRSRVQLSRNVNLARKAVFTEAQCSDFAIADQTPGDFDVVAAAPSITADQTGGVSADDTTEPFNATGGP